jgi:hypothetical protein
MIRTGADCVVPQTGFDVLKLTPQQFGKVFDKLRELGTTGGSEKRLATRMDVQAKVKLASMELGRITRCFTGLTRDVSACGVGLFQHTPAEIGKQFVVSFPSGNSEIYIVCTARFCRAMAEGLFGIGAEFDAIADEATIEEIKLVSAQALDRIRHSILG